MQLGAGVRVGGRERVLAARRSSVKAVSVGN